MLQNSGDSVFAHCNECFSNVKNSKLIRDFVQMEYTKISRSLRLKTSEKHVLLFLSEVSQCSTVVRNTVVRAVQK